MRVFSIIFILALNLFASAQSEKAMIKAGVSRYKEFKVVHEGASELTVPVSEGKMDAKGNVTELVDFNKKGQPKERIVRAYNKHGEMMSESVFLDGSEIPDRVHRFLYSSTGRLNAEEVSDSKGVLIERSEIEYNLMGDKLYERWYDAQGKLLRVAAYEYDTHGMRTEKKEMDAEGKVTEHKRWEFEY